jgi:hypothetical protein
MHTTFVLFPETLEGGQREDTKMYRVAQQLGRILKIATISMLFASISSSEKVHCNKSLKKAILHTRIWPL